MTKVGDYISRIEIDALWGGQKHIVWDLQRHVNILSGVNGVGKSTILNKVVQRLYEGPLSTDANRRSGVKLTFAPSDAATVRFDVIRSFDRPLIHGDVMNKVTDMRLITELDWQIYQLQRRYLDFQVNAAKRIVEMFTGGVPDAQERAQEIAGLKTRFEDLIDELFHDTGKVIDRTSNEIFFLQQGERLTPYQLSSGEKQMLIILLTVLVENQQPYVLLMDEPEISLHVEWQQHLVRHIRELNPQVQIILTTHSPALIMDGWMDAVTDVLDITL